MKSAVIYARVSSIGNRQDTSRQIADLTEYAASHGLDVVRVYDEHQSGAKDRPEWEDCMQYCIEQHIDTLLISELSRAGRSVADIISSIERLTAAGVNVYMQREGINTLTIDKRPQPLLPVIIAVLGAAAQIERECIMSRLNSGRRRYIEQGGKLGRRQGSIQSEDEVRQKYAKVLRLLRDGQSIRNTAKLCDISTKTVQRVKNMLLSDKQPKSVKKCNMCNNIII